MLYSLVQQINGAGNNSVYDFTWDTTKFPQDYKPNEPGEQHFLTVIAIAAGNRKVVDRIWVTVDQSIANANTLGTNR